MSIKARLWISHISMLVIPIILFLIAGRIIFTLLASYYGDSFEEDLIGKYIYNNPTINNEIIATTLENPDKLENQEYLKGLEEDLAELYTGIVVMKNNIPIYATKFLNKPEIIDSLVSYDRSSRDRHDLMRENYFITDRQEFTFSDNSKGNLYLLTNTSYFFEKTDIFKRFFIIGMTIFVLILILTNSILTYMMTKYIIRPLKLLINYTKEIKEGNLDFKVEYSKKDEIGELFYSFDEMRSQLKESEEVKKKYEDNRKELISNISHDLRTPVTSIRGYVEGIMDGVADSPEKRNKYLKTILTKANDMDRLIEDLFTLSKLDLKKIPFYFEKVDIKKYFEDYIEEIQYELTKKEITIDFNSEIYENSLALVDREKFKRVIANIINNASKHMDKDNPKIIITLKEEKEIFVIAITDNGKGIAEKDIPLIFDKFYRADPARSTVTGGSGLGLAISKQIIEEHGGKIWAESEEGLGTSIQFTLKKSDN